MSLMNKGEGATCGPAYNRGRALCAAPQLHIFPPDGLLTLDESKGDVNPHIIAPDPFESDDSLNVLPPPHLSLLTKTEKLVTMSAGDDEPPSGLNGRLRPRKSNIIKPDIPKVVRKETKPSLDKPKRASTASKASPNKQDDLVDKSDISLSSQFLCAFCDKKFASKQTSLKHAQRIHLPGSKQDKFINCLFCNHSEPNASDIIRHMVTTHQNQYFACLDCESRFSSTSELSEHKLNDCDKPKVSYRSKLRQNNSGNKKKKSQKHAKDGNIDDSKEFKEKHDYNGVVISCELKPTQGRNEDDIEDNITTNLILPPGKSLPNNATLDKNAVIVLDDLQLNKRIPSNFAFHNTDTDQILSRLGVVHRSPRNPEPTKREWLKLIDASTQKFERCFDTSFYTKVASNVQENLTKFLDGSFNFNPDPENIINTRKAKNSVVINTAEGFPILLANEQYSRNVLEGYLPRAIAPKHKWKWDNNEAEKIQLNADQIKRDFHTNKCIITLISSLDIWTQLRMRRKYEEKYNNQPVEEKTEKQNAISRELKEILESRDIPTTSQVVPYKSNSVLKNEGLEFPSSLGLTPAVPNHEIKPAVLSGEWVRPRCYVCCACGAQTRDTRGLTSHMSTQHPNAQVQHYEIVGDTLLNSDIMKHLYVPPSQVSNRTRPLRGIKDCTKCKKSISLEDLHQHMLDCAGDTPTIRRRQCRSRPFGVRKRRPRLPDNTVRKKIRKHIRNRQIRQKTHMRPRIRTEVGDAETIRKMLADLPAKRHRVLVNPSNQMSRPRRKLERQRNQIMIKKAKLLETNSKDMNSQSENEGAGSNEPSNNDEPAANSSGEESRKKSRSLRAQASRVRQLRNTRQNQALKRQAVINQAKKRSLRLREQKVNTELIKKPLLRPNSSKTDKTSVENQPKRIDVKVAAYNTREQANRGGNNNRDSNRNEQQPENNESNANNNNNAPPPTQHVPLKHSIAQLTAETERHDKSVQFHHMFLVQQECNNTDQHDIAPGQHNILFENEPALTRLDKPPLDCHKKGSTDKNCKQNKLRKGLNACIAMLKNKLTDTESVGCGSEEIIDINAIPAVPMKFVPVATEPALAPVFMEPLNMSPVSVPSVPTAPIAVEPVALAPVAMEPQTATHVSKPVPEEPVAVEPVPMTPVSVAPVTVEALPVAHEPTPLVQLTTETKSTLSIPTLPTTPAPAIQISVTPEPTILTPASPVPIATVPKKRLSATPEPKKRLSVTPEPKKRLSETPEPKKRLSVTPEPKTRVPNCHEYSTSAPVIRPSIPPLSINIDSSVVSPLPMIPLALTHSLKHGTGIDLPQIELLPKRPETINPDITMAKQHYIPMSHQELVQANIDLASKIQSYKESAKRKCNRSQSYTHQDLRITDNIPIQLNPELIIIPKKSSEIRNLASTPPASSKVRTRRDSVPQRSPNNTSAELNKYRPEVYSPGKQQMPTNILPEIDVYWKNPLEIKPPKKSSVSPRPKSIDNPSHSGNINLLMASERRSHRQLISPEIAVPYETQIMYPQENKVYPNFNLDSCPPAIPPAPPTNSEAFVPRLSSPLDLSARIMDIQTTPYMMCNYEGYEMFALPGNYPSVYPKHKSTHPPPPPPPPPPPLPSDQIHKIDNDVVDLRILQPTDLSMKVKENYDNAPQRRNENIAYAQDAASYRKHKRSHESLRSFRNDHPENHSLSVSGEKTARYIPIDECQIMLSKSDNVSDKIGTANFTSHDINVISESEYQRKFITTSHDENYLSRSNNMPPENEKEYQINAETEKLLHGYNQRTNDPIRQKIDWHNKPATITSGAYVSRVRKDIMINYTKHPQHEGEIFKSNNGDRVSSFQSSQVPIEDRVSLHHLQNLNYAHNHKVPTEDNSRTMSQADNISRTKTPMLPENLNDSTSTDLKLVLEKDTESNKDLVVLNSKAQPLTPHDNFFDNAKITITPEEIVSEKTRLTDKTPSAQTPLSMRETGLSAYDTAHDSIASPCASVRPVPLSQLTSDAKSRNIPLSTAHLNNTSESCVASVSTADVTKIGKLRAEVSFSISKLTGNEKFIDSKNKSTNKSQMPEETKKLQDQDPDTAKKIAMLPKELVDILGNIPATHRDQLLNILPQYVSAVPLETTKSDALIENNAASHLESSTQNINQEHDVLNLSQLSGSQSTSENVTGQNIIDKSSSHCNLAQKRQVVVMDSEEKKPVHLSIENNNKSLSNFENHLEQGTKPNEKGEDIVKVIDLTKDDVSPNNEIIKSTEEIPVNIASIPCQDTPNIVTVDKSTKQKKNSDQTASLRAVRIKTQSERQKHQISIPIVSDKVSPPSIVCTDRDKRQEIMNKSLQETLDFTTSLAIQQSEISSTQQNNKKISVDTLSPPIISTQQGWSEENVHEKSDIVPTEPISLIQDEDVREAVTKAVTKLGLVTSSIVAQKSIPIDECKKDGIAKTSNVLQEIKETDKSFVKVDEYEGHDSTKMHIEVDNCSNIVNQSLDKELLSSNKPDPDDDSEDDISLAKIVEQKQRDGFVKKINNGTEIKPREPQSYSTTRKRKKEKMPKKTNKKLQTKNKKLTDISEKVKDSIAKETAEEVTFNTSIQVSEKIKKDEEIEPSLNIDHTTDNSINKDNVPKEKIKKETAARLKSKGNKPDLELKKKCTSDKKSNDVKPDKYGVYHCSSDSLKSEESNETTMMKENVEMNNIPKDEHSTEIYYDKKSVKQKDSSKKKKRSEIELNTIKSNELFTSPDVKDDIISHEQSVITSPCSEPEIASTSTALPNAKSKHEPKLKKSVKVSTQLTRSSDPTNQISSELSDESSLTPLRRSKRGKSLFIENEATEYEISLHSENSSTKKIPITKKQMIFSKLLLDEDVHKTSSLSLLSDDVNSNKEQDNPRDPELQENDVDDKESEDSIGEKSKPMKRKKSTLLKRKIKKKKSLDMPVKSQIKSPDDSEEQHPDINIKKIRLESDQPVLTQNSVDGINTTNTTENDSQHIIKEKRKMLNVISSSNNTQCSTPKKSKISQDIAEPHKDDSKNKCDDISTEITPSASVGARPTCYNMQVAAKRTRSKSSGVKGTAEYDPYDIDLNDIDFISEPLRKNISISKDIKVKCQDITDSPVDDSDVLKGTEICQSQSPAIVKDSLTEEADGIIEKNSEPDQKETEKSRKPKKAFKKVLKKAKYAGARQRKLIENKLKGYTPRKSGKKNKLLDDGDSDDSSKSDVPLKKYAEQKQKYHTEFTLIVEKVRIDIDQSDSKTSEKCQENNVTDPNKVSEASPSLADKYMENFGFYSERKPRKSNLLATKKISETFHIIANESDEEKSKKRPTNTESRKPSEGKEGVPECSGFHICVRKTRRGRKKTPGSDEDDEDDKCYCALCNKEFRRPDNYLRHQLTLLHIARIAEVQFKIRTTPMIEEPSFLIVYKQQVDRVRMLIQKQARRKKSKKIKVPTIEEILETVRKVVRTQQLKQRGLSNDEALFLDCCELLQEGPQPKPEAHKLETVQLNTVNNIGSSTPSVELIEKFDSRSDGDVDSITARNILESEEVRNLENDLISGLKEAAQAKQAVLQQSESIAVSNEKCIDELSSPAVDTNFDQTEDSDVSEEMLTTSKNRSPTPEYKEKMYPDIEEFDMFEDKFDKIKRKCRSRAAAAKQIQSVAEPSSRHKSRKKAEKKKIKKLKKNYQNMVLTKGALKGFDGIKVSIPTTDINIAAILPQSDISSKKKKKAYSKKKREKKDSVTVTEKPKESSVRTKQLDVYEFMDNEEAELFEFRPSTLMERFKSITSKENKARENSKSAVVPEDEDNLSDNGSDGDDFVYMSDDYVCSDDETESSLLSDMGNKIDTKKNSLKKKDVVEKNAVMGKIFKHNAVRSEKKVVKSMEPAEPKADLDQLFDSLLEDEPSSSMLHDDTLSTKNDSLSSNKKLTNPTKDASREGQVDSLLKRSPTLSPEPYDTCAPKSTVANKTEDDYVLDFGPSTSKKADELYAIMTKKMLSENSKNEDSNTLRESPPRDSYKKSLTRNISSTPNSISKLDEDFDNFDLEDTGVARQRARRKCTVGKQNILAETWSSESEPDGVPLRSNSTESVIGSTARKKKGKKKDGQHSARRNSKNIGKKHDVDSRVNNSKRITSNNSGEGRISGGESAEKAEYSPAECSAPAADTSAAAAAAGAGAGGGAVKPRPRTTAYYSWSSEGDEEPEHVQQHGWIVGDSHKKLVTMLAHAKGRKRNNDEKRHLVE